MNIFVDLDGVLVRFVQGASPLFGTTEEELMPKWQLGCWEMCEPLGITRSQWYKVIDNAGEDFWANLPEYQWRDDLYDFCEKLAPTYILSAPTHEPACLSGKLRWLHKWKGEHFQNYVFTAMKERTARWDRILIDDKPSNVIKFREHGGKAILFPTHANDRYELRERAVEVVKNELLQWHTEISQR